MIAKEVYAHFEGLNLTVEDVANLEHMLGCGEHIPVERRGYRNNFFSGESDLPSMRRLEAAGLVREVGGDMPWIKESPGVVNPLRLFMATDKGKQAMGF